MDINQGDGYKFKWSKDGRSGIYSCYAESEEAAKSKAVRELASHGVSLEVWDLKRV
jgi:hypothetical protein